MLEWPCSTGKAAAKVRSREEPGFESLSLPVRILQRDAPPTPPTPSRRWTVGAKNALSRTVLEPIETSPKSLAWLPEDTHLSLSISSSRRSSRQAYLPPLDADDEGCRIHGCRIHGCRGASEYLSRQTLGVLSSHEQAFVKDAFLRFKSGSAEINCSDLYDVLNHLGYLGITDEAATSLAKEVSRFSTLDFKELLRVVESAGPWEYEQIQMAFHSHATLVKDGAPHLHATRLPMVLHDLQATSEWQAIRESVIEALNFDLSERPSEMTDGSDGFLSFNDVNLVLATLRAAQCCTAALLECAETLFNSVARRARGRLEVSVPRAPELLQRLFDYDASPSISQLCHRLRSRKMSAVFSESDASGDESDKVEPCGPCDSITFSEFLIWLRRLRCLELRKSWLSYQQVAKEWGYVPLDELAILVPDLPLLPQHRDDLCREVGLEPDTPLRFDDVECLKRHCCLMKEFSIEEARYFSGVFGHFQSEDHAGFVDRADCLCIFRYMGYGLNGDEIYSLLLDARAAGHRVLGLGDFLNMIRACRSRQRGMIRTAYEMNAQDMGFSDLSDLDETGSALTMSDDEDSPKELIFGRRQSNDCSRAAFRRRSSVKQGQVSKQVECGHVQGEGLLVPTGALEALGAAGWSLEEDALEEALARIGVQGQRLLSLDDFSNLAKLLREEGAAQKQRQAGWTVSEAQDIHCLYEVHGGSHDHPLGEDQLERLLWDLDVKKGFEELKQLFDKARMQSGEEPGAMQVTLSTLMHLLRFISQSGLRSAFGRESEAFDVEGCSEAEVAGYRDLFRKLQKWNLPLPLPPGSPVARRLSESGLTVPDLPMTPPPPAPMTKVCKKGGSGLKQEYPEILKKMKSALAVPSSIQQVSCAAVMKCLRRLGQRCDEKLTPAQQAELWKKIEDFSICSQRDTLDFAAFVRIMGWVQRTDFASIRQQSDKVGSFFALAESVIAGK
ncbi:unnamed protein product [Effrenium voratum]|uniref:Uncharacterized protein n=1 Tax=Effrenium voratum TaxID=2562239 RepID=A0AA36HSS7_9DINO|nr:unnamed protein product [Effrenium voratum]